MTPTITADEAERRLGGLLSRLKAHIVGFTSDETTCRLAIDHIRATAAELSRLRGVVAEVERMAREAVSEQWTLRLASDHKGYVSADAILSAVGAVGERPAPEPDDVVWTQFHIRGSRIYVVAKFSSSNPNGEGWSVFEPYSPQGTRIHSVATEAEAIAVARTLAATQKAEWEGGAG